MYGARASGAFVAAQRGRLAARGARQEAHEPGYREFRLLRHRCRIVVRSASEVLTTSGANAVTMIDQAKAQLPVWAHRERQRIVGGFRGGDGYECTSLAEATR